jgi:glycosyltransferase involved in cell wall biosynthesis
MSLNKKALIFIEDGSFSYDNRVIRETAALVDQGWDLTVISPRFHGDPFFRKINEKLRAYYYPKPSTETESLAGHLLEAASSLFFGTILAFYVSLRHGFLIFQACNPLDILWLIALPYKALGRKFIFDQHDLVPELLLSRNSDRKSLIYRSAILLERISYGLADAVISTNHSYKGTAISRGGRSPDGVFVVRNGPDLDKFRIVPPKEGLKKDGEILVGYLGNMNPQDGIEHLVEAALYIIRKREIGNIRFVFIGGGASQRKLAERSRSLGLGEYVNFTGRIPDSDVLSILSACDICVQPDPKNPLNDLSTMNKVLEYMALEKPVIAFDLKETRVSCGPAALYAEPNNAIQLAEKIILLAGDKELRQKNGKLGRDRIVSKFSWEYSVPELLRAYQHAAGD